MGRSAVSPSMLAGAAALATTAVAFLHTQRTSQLGAEAEQEDRGAPYGQPPPKRTRAAAPHKNFWTFGWGQSLSLMRERRRRGDPDLAAEVKFKSRFRLPLELFELIIEELRGMPGYVAEHSCSRSGRAAIGLASLLRHGALSGREEDEIHGSFRRIFRFFYQHSDF